MEGNMQFLTISAEEVVSALSYKALIPVIRDVLSEYSDKVNPTFSQPLRVAARVNQHKGLLVSMPGFSGRRNALACKLVTVFSENSKKGLPSHYSKIMLFEPTTGFPISMMDGDDITAMRTAAASVVATQLLCSEPSEPKTVAIIGTGVQAVSHGHALRAALNVRKIVVWGRTRANADCCATKIGAEVAPSAEEAVKGADIICTVTLSKTPVLMKSWVKQGAHINCVGACTADSQELDPELVLSSVIYTDSFESVYKESGDIIQSKAEVYAEVGEVVNGTKEARRNETTLFKNLGIAVEDAVTAKLTYDTVKAKAKL